ncbi:MAG: class I SAM-dependent methyltransferase [Actinomycetota bacterium]|nr:class I SAM-dependent methyltransferase [Actinomycetota bacterium]
MRDAFARWQVAQPDRSGILDSEAIAYVDYHSERYARLLSLVDQLAAEARPREKLRILDIGPNMQTELLRDAHPTGVVDTLGFAHPAIPPRQHERHVEFDLNRLSTPGSGPQLASGYDIVILAEVVEHLHISLATVLRCVAGWLRPPGHVLVQTPNGAALHKRIRLLLGRSPVEPPRDTPGNPGHFHEYTLAELRDQVAAAGMAIERLELANHFGGAGAQARLYRTAGKLLPPTMRHGMTLCARPAP